LIPAERWQYGGNIDWVELWASLRALITTTSSMGS